MSLARRIDTTLTCDARSLREGNLNLGHRQDTSGVPGFPTKELETDRRQDRQYVENLPKCFESPVENTLISVKYLSERRRRAPILILVGPFV